MSTKDYLNSLVEIRPAQNGVVVVYIHGILSDSEKCWRHENGTFWPDLLAEEPSLQDVGIYHFYYLTNIFSGNYSLTDVVDMLKERLELQNMLELRKLVFICHSMGGIIARKFIVTQQTDLIRNNISIGLFLIASPSLGSEYANLINFFAKILKVRNAQAQVLRFSQENSWLNDLDKEFNNIKESQDLVIYGKELIEHKAIVLGWFLQKQVVEPFSGARYFGDPIKVPETDHFSICKIKSQTDYQHEALVEFIYKNVLNADSSSKSPQNKPLDKAVISPSPTKNSNAEPAASPEALKQQSQKIFDLVLNKVKFYLGGQPELIGALASVMNCGDDTDSIAALCRHAQSKHKDVDYPEQNHVCDALGKLTRAIKGALEQLKARGQDQQIHQLCPQAENAISWLLLFSVNEAWLCKHCALFDTANREAIPIDANTLFSAELGLSAVREIAPVVKISTPNPFAPIMPDVIDVDQLLETGPGKQDLLNALKTALWELVFPVPEKGDAAGKAQYQAPVRFERGKTHPDNQKLNGKILALRDGGLRDHYCAVRSQDNSQKKAYFDAVFSQLIEDLPGMRVIIYQVGGTSVLLVLETDIISRIQVIQELMRKYHNETA